MHFAYLHLATYLQLNKLTNVACGAFTSQNCDVVFEYVKTLILFARLCLQCSTGR